MIIRLDTRELDFLSQELLDVLSWQLENQPTDSIFDLWWDLHLM